MKCIGCIALTVGLLALLMAQSSPPIGSPVPTIGPLPAPTALPGPVTVPSAVPIPEPSAPMVAVADCIGYLEEMGLELEESYVRISPYEIMSVTSGTSEEEYEFLIIITSYELDPVTGAQIWSNGCSDPGPGNVGTATVAVFDPEVLSEWAGDQVEPAFLTQEGVIDVPSTGDALMDISFSVPDDEGGHMAGTVRVRKSDGAVAVVDLSMPIQVGNSGPWWPVCCISQQLFCQTIRQLFPWISCKNCASCARKCWQGGSNPCHTCDPCGLSKFLCHIVPGASC